MITAIEENIPLEKIAVFADSRPLATSRVAQ